MIDLIKNQWIGIVAIIFVAFVLMSGTGVIEEGLGSEEVTTISNPHVFTNSVDIKDTLTFVEKSESITADNTITAAESGTTFYVNTNVSTSTLPAVATATGTAFKFVIASAVATNDFRVVSAEGDNIEGSLIVAGAVVDCDAGDRINFVTDGENLGDFVEVRSDGQKWFVTSSNALTSAKLTCSG